MSVEGPPVPMLPDDAAAQAALVELAGLRELVRIIAHDLNNPLQSLTLLLELLEQELGSNATATERAQQCQEAAAQMRELVRHLSEFARDPASRRGDASVASTLDSVIGVCRRRLERHRIEVTPHGDSLLQRSFPALEQAVAFRRFLVCAVLGMIDAAATAGHSRHGLDVDAEVDAVSLLLHGIDADGNHEPVALSAEYVQRLRAACVGTTLSLTLTGPRIRIVFGSS